MENKRSRKEREKRVGVALEPVKPICGFCCCLFRAMPQEQVSHQCFIFADVPILLVSPGREGNIDPLMFLEKLKGGSVSLCLAWLYTWRWEEAAGRLFKAQSPVHVAKRCCKTGGVRRRQLRRGWLERCRACPGGRLRGGGKAGNVGPNLLDELTKVVSKFTSAANPLEKGQVEHVLLDALTKLLESKKSGWFAWCS